MSDVPIVWAGHSAASKATLAFRIMGDACGTLVPAIQRLGKAIRKSAKNLRRAAKAGSRRPFRRSRGWRRHVRRAKATRRP